ncbi:MAG TPA: purine-nucleoside phosphorylase [Bacillales bacterium]|nr:purine-nucleoside phosphorylase [Bacillales bacterium]
MKGRTKLQDAAVFLRGKITESPKVGLILGSGLGVLADEIEQPAAVAYQDIPGFPVSTVAGHKGQLVFGTLEGLPVVAMQGRFHYYEGYSLQEVTFPVRVMKKLGVQTLVVTNASGGIHTDFQPGDLMIIRDHINWLHANPLMGPNDEEIGPRFPDMSEPYSKHLVQAARDAARKINLTLKEGTYLATTGPSYETPAEIRMMRKLGADAVGMSTVPEVISARHAGMDVLGISCVANAAAGILDVPLTHDEVIETTASIRKDFLRLVKAILREMGEIGLGTDR